MAGEESRYSLHVNLKISICLWCLLTASLCGASEVCTGPICEYEFIVRYAQTMTTKINGDVFNVALNGTNLTVIANSFRQPFDYPGIIGRTVDPSDVITADGYSRDVIVINDQFPGPTIEVLVGVQIVIRVVNAFSSEVLSIHWHGLHHHGTYYMDGVSYVTQCPIRPGGEFTYRFIADPPGTHWYHSHHAEQRAGGLYGLLVVHPKLPTLPVYDVVITDWYHVAEEVLDVHDPTRIKYRGSGDQAADPNLLEYTVDGAHISSLKYVSSLLHGRGRYPEDAPYPLKVYFLDPSKPNYFRAACASTQFVYELQADGHRLKLMALDGNSIKPLIVDSVMIHPGETADFELVPDANTSTSGLYWLRGRTIGAGIGPMVQVQRWNITHEVKAILSYDNVSGDDPTSNPRPCLAEKHCLVFNCPYAIYPPGRNLTCVRLTDAKSADDQNELNYMYGLNATEPDEEIFLNFAMSPQVAVNARRFVSATSVIQPGNRAADKYITPCPTNGTCESDGCKCTYIKDLPYNKIVQMVLVNYNSMPAMVSMGGPSGWSRGGHHPVHLHGYDFAVLAVGFAPQDPDSGLQTSPNDAIDCDQPYCANASWNQIVKSNVVSKFNLVDPVVKDTVNVPSLGFVVIRFRSYNPGIWTMHCHILMHQLEGMEVVWNVAEERHPPPPPGFDICRDFNWTAEQFETYLRKYGNQNLSD